MSSFPLYLSVLTVLAFLWIPPTHGANDFKGMDLTKHHPGRVLALLIGTCRKNEDTCQLSIESTANFLSNINDLILNFDKKFEYELLAMIERLSKDLAHCKDVICVMEFEKNHGRLFELAVQKASKLLTSVPEVEKFAWEHSILQPPPFF